MTDDVGDRDKGRSVWQLLEESDRREVRSMYRRIERERTLARAAGEAWTPYRPFCSTWEMLGKFRCGGGERHRNGRRAIEVSYSVYMAGCVVRCAECKARDEKEDAS